jgi:Xaa-Pro aminopeptidase
MTDATTTKKTLESIMEVQLATELAFDAVITYLRTADHPTSEEAHALIDAVLDAHDCESPKGHIVAGSLQSAEPHEFGHGELLKHVPIVIDIYPRSKRSGYFADMTRTVCIGEPTKALQKMYDTVLQAQELAFSLIKPDIVCHDIQKAVEQFFISVGYVTSGKGKEFGYAEGFVHSIGHGVGKEIHQSPHFGKKSFDVLREGDVITIEPGLYYKDIGGVRIEDMVVVTADGFKNLTNYPKELTLI